MSCKRAARLRYLRDLRKWLHRVVSDTNRGRQFQIISERTAHLSISRGWTDYADARLGDGTELFTSSRWTHSVEEGIAKLIYHELRKR